MMSGNEYRRKIWKCNLTRAFRRRWRKLVNLWRGPRPYLAASSVMLMAAWLAPLVAGLEATVVLDVPGVGPIDLALRVVVALAVVTGAFGLWVSTEHQAVSFLAGALLTWAFWLLPAWTFLLGLSPALGVFLLAPASLSFWAAWRWIRLNV